MKTLSLLMVVFALVGTPTTLAAQSGCTYPSPFTTAGYEQYLACYYGRSVGSTSAPGTRAGTAPSAAPTVTGSPAAATNVEVAQGAFTGAPGKLGSFYAEPGKLLVGWDFPAEKIGQAGGAIERISPANQYVLRGSVDHGDVPEGGFAMFALGGGKISVNGVNITMPFAKGVGYLVLVRGRYADGAQDEDLNLTAEVTGFRSGHALYSKYPGNPNGGFVSWAQARQMIGNMHTWYPNCGAEGCSSVYLVAYDTNTGGYTIYKNSKAGLEFVGGNF